MPKFFWFEAMMKINSAGNCAWKHDVGIHVQTKIHLVTGMEQQTTSTTMLRNINKKRKPQQAKKIKTLWLSMVLLVEVIPAGITTSKKDTDSQIIYEQFLSE